MLINQLNIPTIRRERLPYTHAECTQTQEMTALPRHTSPIGSSSSGSSCCSNSDTDENDSPSAQFDPHIVYTVLCQRTGEEAASLQCGGVYVLIYQSSFPLSLECTNGAYMTIVSQFEYSSDYVFNDGDSATIHMAAAALRRNTTIPLQVHIFSIFGRRNRKTKLRLGEVLLRPFIITVGVLRHLHITAIGKSYSCDVPSGATECSFLVFGLDDYYNTVYPFDRMAIQNVEYVITNSTRTMARRGRVEKFEIHSSTKVKITIPLIQLNANTCYDVFIRSMNMASDTVTLVISPPSLSEKDLGHTEAPNGV